MNENEKRRIRKRTDTFTITEGKLYYKGGKSNKGENKLVITKDQKSSILKLCHIGIADLLKPPPSPIKGVEDSQTESDEELHASRPKRKITERRNSIYEYFPVLKKSK